LDNSEKEPPTGGQIEYLKKLGASEEDIKKITNRKEASDKIKELKSKSPVTEKQKNTLRKFGLKDEEIDRLTTEEASEIIDRKIKEINENKQNKKMNYNSQNKGTNINKQYKETNVSKQNRETSVSEQNEEDLIDEIVQNRRSKMNPSDFKNKKVNELNKYKASSDEYKEEIIKKIKNTLGEKADTVNLQEMDLDQLKQYRDKLEQEFSPNAKTINSIKNMISRKQNAFEEISKILGREIHSVDDIKNQYEARKVLGWLLKEKDKSKAVYKSKEVNKEIDQER
jgi:DNA repair exonuclease SbcCD ATPase subunit